MPLKLSSLPPPDSKEYWEILDHLGLANLVRAAEQQKFVLEFKKDIVTETDPAQAWDVAEGLIDGLYVEAQHSMRSSQEQVIQARINESEAMRERAKKGESDAQDESEEELGRQVAKILKHVMLTSRPVPLEDWIAFYFALVPEGVYESSTSSETDRPNWRALLSGPASLFEVGLNAIIPGAVDLDADNTVEGIDTVLKAGGEVLGDILFGTDSQPTTPVPPQKKFKF